MKKKKKSGRTKYIERQKLHEIRDEPLSGTELNCLLYLQNL